MVKTECKVLYILENPDTNSEEHDGAKQQQRWRVYFDNLEYISADFVVISGKLHFVQLFIHVVGSNSTPSRLIQEQTN